MPQTACNQAVACAACVAATVTAILLWGIGAEAVFARDYLPGGLLLANALIVTLLEAGTAWQYLEWRLNRRQTQTIGRPGCCLPLPTPLRAIDTYRRAAVYTVLTVPCFVHLRRLWLPLVPGAMLLASAALYAMKYCCIRRSRRTIVKIPTFVRFKDEAASAETPAFPPSDANPAAHATKLSHQSSFTSSHSGCSVQMGSKDSGIEAASQRDGSATAAATTTIADSPVATAAVAAADASSKVRSKPRGLVRAYSSSPDRCCLINEDSLSLQD